MLKILQRPRGEPLKGKKPGKDWGDELKRLKPSEGLHQAEKLFQEGSAKELVKRGKTASTILLANSD